MLDSNARHIIDQPMHKVATFLTSKHITANTITATAFVLGVFTAVLIALGQPIMALIALWLSGVLDVLDGQVARLMGTASPAGAYFDLISDRLVECLFIISLVIAKPSLGLVAVVLLATFIYNFSTFVVAGALMANHGVKSMHYDVGLIERTETFIIFTLMLLLPAWQSVIMLTMALLTAYTGTRRFIKMYRRLADLKEKQDVKKIHDRPLADQYTDLNSLSEPDAN